LQFRHCNILSAKKCAFEEAVFGCGERGGVGDEDWTSVVVNERRRNKYKKIASSHFGKRAVNIFPFIYRKYFVTFHVSLRPILIFINML
jgi:hypothetical protein